MELASSSTFTSKSQIKSLDKIYNEQGQLLQGSLPVRPVSLALNSAPYHSAVASARTSGLSTPNTVLDDFEGMPYKSAMLLNTELPLPLTDVQSNSELSKQSPRGEYSLRDSVRLPLEVAKRLFEAFVERILIQNPIFLEDDIRAHFNAVYCTPGVKPSGVSMFMVSMVLAISTMTSRAYDFNKIVQLSESLHCEALKHCDFLGTPGIVALQGILLLMQFAELLPSTGSLWHLAGEAVSLALQLGLHRDPYEAADIDFVSLDLRRRVFWTVYCMERSITVTSHRRFILKDEHINVEFPTEFEDSHIKTDGIVPGGRRTKLQFLNYIRFRQIQAEILAVQFFDREIPFDTYEEWSAAMEKRLVEWRHDSLSQSEVAPDWFHHAVWQCYLMLHRPCPRNPTPTEQSMMSCVEAAMGLSKGSWELLKTGYLTYPFHNAHNGFEATTVVLYGLKHHAKMMQNRYGSHNVVDLISSLSSLFDLLSVRWPAASKIGEFLHDLKKSTLKTFLEIPNESPLSYELYQPDQLDHIVLHHSLEDSASLEVVPRKKEAESPIFSRSEGWFGSTSHSDSNFTSQNFANISERSSGLDRWLQKGNYATITHDIKPDFDAQTWSENATDRSHSPPKESHTYGLDLEVLQSTTKLLPSCNRCRARRIKCEREVLECQNCIDSGSACVYKDKLLARDIPCSYIETLQQRLHEMTNNQKQPQQEDMVMTISSQIVIQAGNSAHVHVKTTAIYESSEASIATNPRLADATFFGYTSAVSQISEQRFSSPRAQATRSKSTHRGLKDLSRQIFRQDPELPPKATTMMLIEVFNHSVNVIYHIIDEAVLRRICTAMYEEFAAQDPFDEQAVYLIIAISLQVLSKGDSSLSTTSLAYFRQSTMLCRAGTAELKRYSLQSLRSTLLVCIYVLLRPHAGDIWRLVAFASRVCFDIGNMSKRDQSEHRAYFLMYQTLHCIDCNVSVVFGRPSQLPQRSGPLTDLLPNINSVLNQGRVALYYHNLSRIKSHMHNALMIKYADQASAHQKIQTAVEECRTHLNNWRIGWTAEMEASKRDSTGELALSAFNTWGNLLYYDTYLLLQRYSTAPVDADDKLHAADNLLQSCNKIFEEGAAAISEYLSDSSTKAAAYFYPTVWTCAHTILSSGIDIVNLKNETSGGTADSTFKTCITLLAHLEGDSNNLLDGFTQTLETLYASKEP